MFPLALALSLFLSSVFSSPNTALAVAPSTQVATTVRIAQVPFYSQFADISSSKWQKVGCGITSLAMIIDYYKPNAVQSVDSLLNQGIALGAYANNAGWSHAGLIAVSKKYGLTGTTYDFSGLSKQAALDKITGSLHTGPVIASVHYKFDPKSTIPHLVVIDGIKGDIVYYNDPAAKTGQKQISVADFQKGWKQRYIVIRPSSQTATKVAVV
jgi:ABC-type bacteriocin/lantibiotic exporter with double-glycine peptidase domain